MRRMDVGERSTFNEDGIGDVLFTAAIPGLVRHVKP